MENNHVNEGLEQIEDEIVNINEEDIDRVIDVDDNEEDFNDIAEDAGAEGETEDVEMFEPVSDSSKLTFEKHTDVVYCISLHPSGLKMAVTGGQDDKAYLWDTETGNVVLECNGHKDSVTSVAFSFDGTYVATADLSGFLKVWKVSSREEVWSFECDDIEWIQWHSHAHVLLAGTATGQIWMWKIPSGDCKTFTGLNSTVTCGRILPDGKRLCAGFENGMMKVIELKDQTSLHSLNVHSECVTCLDCYSDNNLVISGSSDLTCHITNINNGKVVSSVICDNNSNNTNMDNSVESVAFSKTHPWAAVGTLDGTIYLWDVQAGKLRNKWQFDGSLVKLKWLENSPQLFTAGLDGIIRLWDTRDGLLSKQWHGHRAAIMDFEISSDGSLIGSVSQDKTAKIFSMNSST
ncbi:angio-associated migratory cell protein [Octopus bimaculoides]|uniref:Angio-associated migratory cell protein n=1 Tax=Octopus bimaculoides TaxID=37653 RepID=A0A0L8IF34_OCTBM|nr:angio-associated migratory cell protein [Octopus bimaculoides]|eukprot:XP_014770699.1 PREDICTED: angio-associated migratory cell protein-like [Octopus bimaculoides]